MKKWLGIFSRATFYAQRAGLKEDATAANIKLRRLNQKYKEFSKAAGLPEQRDRIKAYTPKESTSKAPESIIGQEGEPFDPQKAVESVIKRLEKSHGIRDNISNRCYYGFRFCIFDERNRTAS